MSEHYCADDIPNAIEVMNKSQALQILDINEEDLNTKLEEKYNDLQKKLEKVSDIDEADRVKCIDNINSAYKKLKEIITNKNVNDKRVSLERQLLIDSRFRKSTEKSSTNFSIELDTTLTNVSSLRLNTITIPTSWHVFSNKKANTCLEINSENDPTRIVKCIQNGTYPSEEKFVEELNNVYGDYINFAYNTLNSRITITNDTSNNLKIYFYKNNSWSDVCSDDLFQNNNLGWYMGFREHVNINTDDDQNVYIELDASGNVGASIEADTSLDITGPKYLVLAIDDFNTNQSNNSIVSSSPITNISTLPSYYNAAKNSAAPGGIYLNTDPPVYSEFVCVENKINTNYPFLFENPNYTGVPTLNSAQLTTINSIIETRQMKNHKFPHTSISNAFAIIPIIPTTDKYIILSAGDETGRIYFNPVSINRLHIKLYDDFGRILDINNDWVCNILVHTNV